MNTNIIGRSCAAAVISVIGIASAVAPAQAEDPTPSCDLTALSASIDQAKADARVAQKAYTIYTRTSMKALVKIYKAHEIAEARATAKKASRLTAAAAKDATIRDAAQAARATARVEAKEAARVRRASFAELKRQVRVERAALKVTWNAAKAALASLRQQMEDCTETPEAETPPASA
ncbi:hypothetical protein [Aeromicrobium sp.]|uniref:hypothetical protein n=1 Tax=Aeromicrobium sp. TaxID=1871063 RepID=UPI003C4F8FC7